MPRPTGASLIGVLVSLPGHLLACAGLYLAINIIHAAPPSVDAFLLLAPLGFITTAVPISVGGICFGQAAMYALFEMVARGSSAAVSSAFTLYQTLLIAT